MTIKCINTKKVEFNTQYEMDMEYIATFEKECAIDPEFLLMNPKGAAHVDSLYKKYNLIEGE